jgi:hypothetical protein
LGLTGGKFNMPDTALAINKVTFSDALLDSCPELSEE